VQTMSGNTLQDPDSTALAALIDNSHDALIIRDLEDVIQFWSKGAERLYGWTAEEAIGKNLFCLLNSQRSGPFFRRITKSGNEIFVESRLAYQFDENGQPVSVLIANRDVTEKRKLESEILHAQRIESTGRLSSVVAHDLNNALSVMRTAISGLLQQKIDGASRQALESSKFHVEHSAHVIEQYLSLGRETGEESTSIHLGDLVREASVILRSAFPKSIDIQTGVANDLWAVRGNATQLYQVLLNLCLNARDAMPSGGKLTIEAGNEELSSPAGRYVFLRVTDTGTGIPPEFGASIFNAFFTTKKHGKGVGLGLFAAEKIVKNHSGVIDFSSAPNEGTEFAVHLPAETSERRILHVDNRKKEYLANTHTAG
jgi:two-component system, cell cycle sensor histidine kinase and response regulator CckA